MAKGETAIYKYPVPITTGGSCVVEMPKGARALSLQVQDGEPVLWMLCDPSTGTERRLFTWYPTGHIYDAGGIRGEHVGTIQLYDGRLVWHLFEAPR